MIRFEKLAATEKNYPFIDAVAVADYANGTFGTISDGKFTAGASFMAIMQIERGDDMKTDKFVVKKDEHIRVADFSKVDGHIVNITSDQLPKTYKAKDKLIADSTGKFVVSTSATNNYFEVIEPTRYGVRATVVVGTPAPTGTK